MRIGLIDVDGHNYPNLALMKLSAYHKQSGDDVSWYFPFEDAYDKVYMSKVFSFSPDYDFVVNAKEVIRGGSGYCISSVGGKEEWNESKHDVLPPEVEHIYPDYSLYGIDDTAYGFLTRGCPRGCSFCIVGKKEGLCSRKVADLSEFWRGQKNIVLNDPNILACKDWEGLLTQLLESNAYIDFNQGLDIRLMTEDKAQMLSRMRIKQIHFAWDRYQDKDIVVPKLEMFARYKYKGKNPDHSAIVYTIVNFDTTFEQDLERIYTLRDMGYWAYVMIYNKENCPPLYRDLARWVNNRFIFASCKRFEDYRNRHFKECNQTLF